MDFKDFLLRSKYKRFAKNMDIFLSHYTFVREEFKIIEENKQVRKCRVLSHLVHNIGRERKDVEK